MPINISSFTTTRLVNAIVAPAGILMEERLSTHHSGESEATTNMICLFEKLLQVSFHNKEIVHNSIRLYINVCIRKNYAPYTGNIAI